MLEFGVCSLFFGLIGLGVCLGGAWAMRENKKWMKIFLIIGAVCLVLFIAGIVIMANESPSYSSSPSSPSSSPSVTCQFKNSNGTRTCTNKATRGELCEYHFQMLDDIYHDFVD